MSLLKSFLFSVLLIIFTFYVSGFPQANDWDALDRQLRGISDYSQKIEIFNMAKGNMPAVDEGNSWSHRSVVYMVSRAYEREGDLENKEKLLIEAVAIREQVLKAIEANGSLDDYKDYCLSLGDMCKTAGLETKMAYYYQEGKNAQPKNSTHQWEQISEKMMGFYGAGEHQEVINLYEKSMEQLDPPKEDSEVNLSMLTILSGAYSEIGDDEKLTEVATKYTALATKLYMAELPDEQRAAFEESQRLAAEMEEEFAEKEDNRKQKELAKSQSGNIGKRLGVKDDLSFDFEDYSGFPSQTREMYRQMITSMNEDYLKAPDDQKEALLDKLAREHFASTIYELNPYAIIPDNATFDDVFDLMDEAVTESYEDLSQVFETSGALDSLKQMMDGMNESVKELISFYNTMAEDYEQQALFSESDRIALEALETMYMMTWTDKELSSRNMINAIAQDRSKRGKALSEARRLSLQEIIIEVLVKLEQIEAKSRQMGFAYSESAEQEINYLEDIIDWIGYKEQQDLIDNAAYYRIIHDELQKSFDAGEIIAMNDIRGLSLGSKQLDQWGRYQEVFLRAAAQSLEETTMNIFGEYKPLDYNQMLASKSLDYKTRRFLVEGASTLTQPAIRQKYNTLRQQKEALGQINMMPDTTQVWLGWDSTRIVQSIFQVKKFERDIYKEILEYKEFNAFIKKYFVTWQEIQAALESDEIFVDVRRIAYGISSNSRSEVKYLFVIIPSDGDPEVVIRPDMFAKEKLYVNDNSKGLSSTSVRPDADYIDSDVYNWFWLPIQNAIRPEITKVYLSPDGVYHNLSFDAMQDKEGNYLVDQLSVIRLVEVAYIKEHTFRNTNNIALDGKIHLFGYPAYNQIPDGAEQVDEQFSKNLGKIYKQLFSMAGSLSDLEGTKEEVEGIKIIASGMGQSVNVYMGIEATEKRLKNLDSPAIIHLATHGKYLSEGRAKKKFAEQKFTENPMLRSHIYLAGAKKAARGKIVNADNGIVTAEEVSHLDLNGVKLVVLSACETALGKSYTGEGIYGLQRAFLEAGAESVVISLWEVSDAATKDFMTSFYSKLLDGNHSKYQAFYAAQKDTRVKYKHPHYWAPFIMVGR